MFHRLVACQNAENAHTDRSDGCVCAWTHHGKSEPIVRTDSERGDEGLGHVVRRVERRRIILDLQPHGGGSRPRPSVFSSPRITRPTPHPLDVHLVHVPQRDLSTENPAFRVSDNEWVHAMRSLMQVYDQAKHDKCVSVQTAAL